MKMSKNYSLLKRLCWVIATLPIVLGASCCAKSERDTNLAISNDINRQNLSLLPYELASIDVTPPASGDALGFSASATYFLHGTNDYIKQFAHKITDCQSSETKTLVQNVVYRLSKQTITTIDYVFDFKKVGSGTIPIKLGNASCYASTIAHNGVRQALIWGVNLDQHDQMHVILGISVHQAKLYTDQATDFSLFATLRSMVIDPMSDNVETFYVGEQKNNLPSCVSKRTVDALEKALNQIYPGAAPYGPSLYKIVKVANVSQLVILPNVSTCIATITTDSGSDAKALQWQSYGSINADRVFRQSTHISYTYGIQNGQGKLETTFNSMVKSAPF